MDDCRKLEFRECIQMKSNLYNVKAFNMSHHVNFLKWNELKIGE